MQAISLSLYFGVIDVPQLNPQYSSWDSSVLFACWVNNLTSCFAISTQPEPCSCTLGGFLPLFESWLMHKNRVCMSSLASAQIRPAHS